MHPKELMEERVYLIEFLPYISQISIDLRTTYASIFTAEAAAILLALKNQNISKTQRDVAIFTDCLEVTNALKEEIPKTSPCIINQIRHESDQLQRSMKIQICVVWIPGHVGETNNEQVNASAIRATEQTEVEIRHQISTTDAKQTISKHIDTLWQTQWNDATKGLHYRSIEPTVTRRIKLTDMNRKREVIKTRLRLGKCCMNSYLKTLNRHHDGNCNTCHVPETIEHYILECRNNVELFNSVKNSCTKQNIRSDLAEILKNPETLNIVTDYIIRSKRLI